MDFKLWWFLPVCLISASFVAVVLPAIVRTANKMNLYDSQDERKVHIGNVPSLSGIETLSGIASYTSRPLSVQSVLK